MTVSDFGKVQYLSCVEAYFGAWIRRRIPLPALYSKSYLSWPEITRAFADDRVSYAAFSFIERLQDFAEHIGITTHRKVCGIPNENDRKDLLLISVTERFFDRQRPWRNDHYIAVTKHTKRKIVYLNEYPLEKGEILSSDFSEKIGKDCLIFSWKKRSSFEFEDESDSQLQAIVYSGKGNAVTLTAIRLRDAVGILRVSRRRTVEWLDWYSRKKDIPFHARLRECLMKQIFFADKCYFQLQRMILRGGEPNQSLLREVTETINALEFELREKYV